MGMTSYNLGLAANVLNRVALLIVEVRNIAYFVLLFRPFALRSSIDRSLVPFFLNELLGTVLKSLNF